MSNMKAKKIYLTEELLQKIQSEIAKSGQSFTDYVRTALMCYDNTSAPLPYDNFRKHTEQMSKLSNIIHQYTLAIVEKDLYADCLPDLIFIQNQLQQLINIETELAQYVMNEKRGNENGNY